MLLVCTLTPRHMLHQEFPYNITDTEKKQFNHTARISRTPNHVLSVYKSVLKSHLRYLKKRTLSLSAGECGKTHLV